VNDEYPTDAAWHELQQEQIEWLVAHEPPQPSWIRLYETNKDTHMKIGDMIESKYLKQSDVGDEEITVTVQGLKKVNVARDDEDPEYRWTVKFNEFPKPMVLNVTNLKRMGKALGDDTEDWLGNTVILYVDPDIEFGGNVVGGLRVKSVPRKVAKARPKSDDEINAALDDGRDPTEVPF